MQPQINPVDYRDFWSPLTTSKGPFFFENLVLFYTFNEFFQIK
jgi:hypothetical protein